MLVEVTFVRDAHSVSEVSPATPIEPDNVVGGAFVREPRAAFATGIVSAPPPSGVENFTELEDVPQSYIGAGGMLVAVDAAENSLEFIPQPPPPTFQGSYLISGGGVAWLQNFDYSVSPATYVISGVQYTSIADTVTLDAADPTLDRIDVIAVDNTGAVVVITGAPGGPPIEPAIDPATQLKLTFVYVQAGATAPPITEENLYLENTEYTSSTNSAGTINLASTNNPYAGTKDIEGTNVANGNLFTLVKPSGTLQLSAYQQLVFQIRSKGGWPNQKSINIFWLNGTTVVGTTISLKTGQFGFNSSNTTTYQQIVIPVSAFNAGNGMITSLRFSVSGGGGNIGWYIDNIVLQSGTAPPPPSGGDFSTNTNVSVAGELVAFADTTGKLGRRGVEGTDYLGSSRISDAAYDATTWNGDATHAPSKNAVRDKIEAIVAGISTVSDAAYDATTWDGVTTVAPSKNAVRDKFESLVSPVDDTAYDATTWDGDTTHAPSKNAVRDKIEAMLAAGGITANQKLASLGVTIDGAGAVISAGSKGYIYVPYDCTIQQVTLLANQSGSIVVEVRRCTYTQFDAGGTHPVTGDKISASAPPTISSSTKAKDSTLTGWTTALVNDDVLEFVVTGTPTNIQRLHVGLKVSRT